MLASSLRERSNWRSGSGIFYTVFDGHCTPANVTPAEHFVPAVPWSVRQKCCSFVKICVVLLNFCRARGSCKRPLPMPARCSSTHFLAETPSFTQLRYLFYFFKAVSLHAAKNVSGDLQAAVLVRQGPFHAGFGLTEICGTQRHFFPRN